jgi:hypothetical protein
MVWQTDHLTGSEAVRKNRAVLQWAARVRVWSVASARF